MATISTRKPYKVTNSGDISKDLYVEIRIYKAVDGGIAGAPPTLPQYTVKKQRYNLTSQLLSVDVSPFIRDFFSMVAPNPISAETLRIKEDLHYKADIEVQGVSVTYDCYYGYEDFTESLCASIDVEKNIFVGTNQFITVDLTGMVTIKWTAFAALGTQTVTVAYSNDAIGNVKEIPVVHPTLSMDDKYSVKVEGYNTGGASPNFERNYRVDCPYDEGITVGYVNRYGVYETFDTIGKKERQLKSSGEYFTSFSDGANTAFLKNSKGTYTLNTGWVLEAFSNCIEDLLMSESIVLYVGSEVVKVKLTDTSIIMQTAHNDKMINYTLQFEEAKMNIDII